MSHSMAKSSQSLPKEQVPVKAHIRAWPKKRPTQLKLNPYVVEQTCQEQVQQAYAYFQRETARTLKPSRLFN